MYITSFSGSQALVATVLTLPPTHPNKRPVLGEPERPMALFVFVATKSAQDKSLDRYKKTFHLIYPFQIVIQWLCAHNSHFATSDGFTIPLLVILYFPLSNSSGVMPLIAHAPAQRRSPCSLYATTLPPLPHIHRHFVPATVMGRPRRTKRSSTLLITLFLIVI